MAPPRPRRLIIQGFEVIDVRHFWEPSGFAGHRRPSQKTIIYQAIHNHSVLFT
ncbi:hypothetical protein LCGC14_1879000, partial [marine sediment metagenome]